MKSLTRLLPCHHLLLTSFIAGALSFPRTPPTNPNIERPPCPNTTTTSTAADVQRTNPIVPGWYADPDAIKFGSRYWVYATISTSYANQASFDAFSSPDLVHWTEHSSVFSTAGSQWAESQFWAPCAVERDGTYYLYYTANNPVVGDGTTGIGVAVSDRPDGPFVDLIHEPIVGERVNGGNAMDPQVFVDDDDDNTTYLVWGGTHANVAPLTADMASLGAWADGSTGAVDITPSEGFVEGPFMMKHGGRYYFMWSEGGYGTPDYRVAYAVADAITGPFERVDVVLQKDGVVADGPGHHSVFADGEGGYYIVYHRRIIGDDAPDHRVLAVDRLYFEEDGSIRPVVMT